MPKLANQIRYEKRIYPVLVAIQSLLYTISPSSAWAVRLRELLSEFSEVSLTNMGIPEDWDQDPFWEDALKNTD